MTKGSKQTVRAWLRQNAHIPIGFIPVSAYGLAASYFAWVAYVIANPDLFPSSGADDIYAITSIAQGVLFGFYASHYISKWWELRVGTGTVSGAVADIAMMLKGYFVQATIDQQKKDAIAQKLKVAHLLHLCEVFSVRDPSVVLELVDDHDAKTKAVSLIDCLSDILGEITMLSEQVGFSDSVKFSILPAVQANLSAIRSSSGDCTMILNTELPRLSTWFVYVFTALHVMYLPIYLGAHTAWDSQVVTIGASLGATLVAGFLLIVNRCFVNPFVTNGFNIERIVEGTFAVVDECLGSHPTIGSKSRKRI